MRITTWNCRGAFRKKEGSIRALAPDIAVIQECESLDKFPDGSFGKVAFQWFGDTGRKGIGIGSCTGLHFELFSGYDNSIRYCIPIVVSGRFNFHLIAVWAMNDRDRAKRYIGQVCRALERYEDFIAERDCILLGDFNSNRIWDQERPACNHTSVVNRLKAAGITSAYHHYFGEEQGEESQSTFYMYGKQGYPFHLDYCFIPERWATHILSVTVGDYARWSRLSDHCPLTVDLALNLDPRS
jgi:exonuclease III